MVKSMKAYRSKTRSPIFFFILALIILFVFPKRAFAHGGDGIVSPMAGPLAWGFLGFGILVILGVAAVLINAKPPLAQDDLSRAFQESSGWKGYIHRVKLFSRNARLYMIHVVGMDVIYGTWSGMFNR